MNAEYDFNTPMMVQYMEIKKQYQDCLLFFRMGDFYELFLEDAKIGARVLDITLTARSKGKDGRVPMAGVPYHAVDSYLNKLVKAGYKVAICEQLTPPNNKGLVKRDVVRVVTPGTVMDEKALDRKKNNYVIALLQHGDVLALAAADVSTGYFYAVELQTTSFHQVLSDELSRFTPSECILSDTDYNNAELLQALRVQPDLNIFPFHEWEQHTSQAERELKHHFNIASLHVFGLHDKPFAQKAAAALLGYLKNTQKQQIEHIKKIVLYAPEETMLLDRSTIVNLELFSTIRDQEKRGSLLHALDHTVTAMGGRMMRNWLMKPLLNKKDIQNRLELVGEYVKRQVLRKHIREELEQIHDIERVLGRMALGLGNAKDLIGLKLSLKKIGEIGESLKALSPTLAGELSKRVSPNIAKIVKIIDTNILEDPAFDPKNGGLIKDGVNPKLDSLRTVVRGGKDWVVQLEQQERERTGIGSLKVRFNKVFGFYIEVSKSNLSQVPADYQRKQTLVNGERFITPELKEKEELILSSEEELNLLEYEMFLEVVGRVLEHIEDIQNAADMVAVLDCVVSFAHVSQTHNYVKPEITNDGTIVITQGRHPVVERLLHDERFVPNDVTLDTTSHQLLMITGPNMAGKSVFIRQVAVITLMAQIGCFVPAEKARISLVDRIFVRSGASDVITSGLSTFMVEMVETAHILNNTTENSLIVMDEIGRGTSTYDGISIAWAVAEYLVTNTKCAAKTLFATHYHELQTLEDQYPDRIKNFHMAVEEEQGKPVFLHTVVPGGASHSFGIAVAKLAGVPEHVTQRAREILESLEKRNTQDVVNYQAPLLSYANTTFGADIISELQRVDLFQTTPLQALNILAELKKKAS